MAIRRAKAIQLRISPEDASRLEVVAKLEGISTNRAICDAVSSYVEEKCGEPGFERKLSQKQKEERDLFTDLGSGV